MSCATSASGSVASARRRVRLLPVAEGDLSEAVAFLAAESLRAGLRLAERVEAALARLALHPELGRVPRDEQLMGMGYRVLVVDDYLVFYTPGPGEVLVHRIIHGARDLRDLL